MEHGDDVALTASVPEFGRVAYGLSKTAAYDAANAGEIPTIKIRGKMFVPLRVALQPLLGADSIDVGVLWAKLRNVAERRRSEISSEKKIGSKRFGRSIA